MGNALGLYGEEFIQRFKSFQPTAKVVSGRREMVVRCRYCGDSSDPRKAHMYISIPQSPEEVSLYECKKCKEAGIVDAAFLQLYECQDSEFIIDITRHINESKKNIKYAMVRNDNKYNIRNNYISDIADAQRKLAYVNSRLGVNLTIQQALGLKLVFKLSDIIVGNGLQPTRHDGTIADLSNHFVGFITYDNSATIMRKYDDIQLTNPYLGAKYINYHFIPQEGRDKCMYYVIPSQIDLENGQPTQIHVAEGVFDVLGIMLNVCNGALQQNVYISASGKSYAQAIQFILERTGLINYTIHMYPDADVSDRELDHIALRRLSDLPATIYIHRNTYPNEKDYGVPRDHIRDSIVRTIYEKT